MHRIRMRRTLIGILLLLGFGTASNASENRIRADWTELKSRVQGRKISTVLTDGARLEGRVVALKPEALVVAVSKTSQPARFRGTSDVPRELVSTLRVSRPGWKWRVILPVTGLVVLGTVGGAIGAKMDPGGFIISDGAANGIVVGAIAGAVGGYIAGHYADRKSIVIDIIR